MTQNHHKCRLGRELRTLRKRRGLTLSEVATASQRIATDSAGRISQPYLSQIEADRAGNIGLPKLLTLAALYGITPGELIALAHPRHRKRLNDDWLAWESAGKHIPHPIDYYTPEDKRRAIDERIDHHLALRAGGVNIPFKVEAEARLTARVFAFYAAMRPFLDSDRMGSVRLFWASHGDFVTRVLNRPQFRASLKWYDVVSEFERWLVYDLDLVDRFFPTISTWSFDFGSELTACHFTEPLHEQCYAFVQLPFALLRGVRWRQLANILAGAAPPAQRPTLPPPSPIEGARDYIHDLLAPTRIVPTSAEDPPASLVIREVCQLAEDLPGLSAHTGVERETHAAIVKFLHTAAAESGPRQRAKRHEPPTHDRRPVE